MQQDVLNLAAGALDLFDVTESTDIARFIKMVTTRMNLGVQSSKKNMSESSPLLMLCCLFLLMQDFDRVYRHRWQCIVGTEYGSFVTHSHGCFIYFGIGNQAILLFKGAVNQADEANLIAALETVNA